MILLHILFWTGMFLVAYTYLFFPLVLTLLGRKKTAIDAASGSDASLPRLSMLISAYNEEAVIAQKIESILLSDYPVDKLEILVGSDASTDATNAILESLAGKHEVLRFYPFGERTGKPGIINELAAQARGEVLVISDANVMLDRDTLRQLAVSFATEEIGLVDSQMINTQVKRDGISHQERFYISREVRIKHLESVLWGSMMGPFGGCYAVRKRLFTPVPDHFLVDDFFINMSVLKQKHRCISQIKARVYEDVSNDLREEFRRKKRISAGNFQNLAHYRSLLWSRQPGVAFCFLSHKVIRWLVPFLVLLTLLSSFLLAYGAIPASPYPLYQVLFLLQVGVIGLPVIDHFLRKLGLQSLPLRFVSHFVLMNLALMAGFFQYTGGIRNNVWEPTRRNQGKAQSH